MIDHLSLGVRDLIAAKAFYDAFLEPLGHKAATNTEAELSYGPSGVQPQFFLYPVKAGEIAVGSRTHVAFTAPTEAAALEAFAAAMGNGASCVRVCGPHPDISDTYFGAILFDPDGNKLEVVAHATEDARKPVANGEIEVPRSRLVS